MRLPRPPREHRQLARLVSTPAVERRLFRLGLPRLCAGDSRAPDPPSPFSNADEQAACSSSLAETRERATEERTTMSKQRSAGIEAAVEAAEPGSKPLTLRACPALAVEQLRRCLNEPGEPGSCGGSRARLGRGLVLDQADEVVQRLRCLWLSAVPPGSSPDLTTPRAERFALGRAPG